MISDLSLAERCVDLGEYYDGLCSLQAERHGIDYLLVHDALADLLGDCLSYAEFGVNQGTTLALALLEGVQYVHGYDIDLSHYRPAHHLFRQYAEDHGLGFAVTEADSLKVKLAPVDLLYIDSYHTARHLQLELDRHANKVRKYIVIHDTNARRDMAAVAKRFKGWRVMVDCRQGVGYTVLEK